MKTGREHVAADLGRILKSKRKGMTDREYTELARWEAAAWGQAVAFWIREGNARSAGRRARLAARWGLNLLGREVS